MKSLCLFAIIQFMAFPTTNHGLAPGCPLSSPVDSPVCLPTTDSPYRPVDGKLRSHCTNPGQSFKPYDRMQRVHYNDCVWSMRKATSQKDLPIVRQVVNSVFRPFRRDLTCLPRTPNFLSAMLGQYIAHDIGSRFDTKNVNNSSIQCCTNTNEEPVPVESLHPGCCPIVIPEHDPDYAVKFPKVHCLNLVRSKTETGPPPADEVNEVTAFLDNSNLYGSDQSVCNSLRTRVGGRMLTSDDNILPERNKRFFLGDSRLNQTPQLQILHAIFLREHNRIAGHLQKINAHWDDDRLFEETRRIVIAQYEHVVYEEFLPTYVNSRAFAVEDKSPLDAVAFNEFSASVFRVFHSFIPTQIELIDDKDIVTKHKLHRLIGDSRLIRTQFDDIARGLLSQEINTKGYDPDLFHGIFAPNDDLPGFDLSSIDLIRGRDHGIPPYANILQELRGAGGESVIKCFNHLSPDISEENIALLRNVYESVADIDLMVGAVLERPLKGFLLGRTSQAIIAYQFQRLKTADPYFYTNPDSPKPFTNDQLKQIRKASTNLLFCENSGVSWVPKVPSIAPATGEDYVACSSLEKISYEDWREEVPI